MAEYLNEGNSGQSYSKLFVTINGHSDMGVECPHAVIRCGDASPISRSVVLKKDQIIALLLQLGEAIEQD